jgi:hypothetical protein
MKQKLIMLLAGGLALAGCSDKVDVVVGDSDNNFNPVLTADTECVVVLPTGAARDNNGNATANAATNASDCNVTVGFTANTDWQVTTSAYTGYENPANWLLISQQSGKSGDNSLSLSVENPNYQLTRYGTIKIVSNTYYTQQISVIAPSPSKVQDPYGIAGTLDGMRVVTAYDIEYYTDGGLTSREQSTLTYNAEGALESIATTTSSNGSETNRQVSITKEPYRLNYVVSENGTVTETQTMAIVDGKALAAYMCCPNDKNWANLRLARNFYYDYNDCLQSINYERYPVAGLCSKSTSDFGMAWADGNSTTILNKAYNFTSGVANDFNLDIAWLLYLDSRTSSELSDIDISLLGQLNCIGQRSSAMPSSASDGRSYQYESGITQADGSVATGLTVTETTATGVSRVLKIYCK